MLHVNLQFSDKILVQRLLAGQRLNTLEMIQLFLNLGILLITSLCQ